MYPFVDTYSCLREGAERCVGSVVDLIFGRRNALSPIRSGRDMNEILSGSLTHPTPPPICAGEGVLYFVVPPPPGGGEGLYALGVRRLAIFG